MVLGRAIQIADALCNTRNTRASRNIIFIDFRFVHTTPISSTFIRRRHPETIQNTNDKTFRTG